MAILSSSFFSFLSVGFYLFELYLVLKVVDGLKVERFFEKATRPARFILALIVVSLAFPTVNASLSRYLSGLLGSAAPLAKILLLLEAVVFIYVLTLLYKSKSKSGGQASAPDRSGGGV